MRQHCKNQHKFDPMPSDNQEKPIFLRQERQTNHTTVTLYSDANRRSFSVVENFLNLKKFGPEFVRDGHENLVRSPNSMFNHLIDNYVFINKDEISGVSGYVCTECLGFEFHYIKDIRHDLSAEEKHQCVPAMVYEAKTLEDRIEKLNELRERATQSLVDLSYLTFPHVIQWSVVRQVTDRGYEILIRKKN